MSGGRAVWILWVCFVIRGIACSALMPMWEGYDEWAHFAYVQHLVNGEALSVPGVSRPSREVMESRRLAPAAWTQRDVLPGSLSYEAWWALSREQRAERRRALDSLPDEFRGEDVAAATNYESQQPPLYYWLCAPLLKVLDDLPLPARVFALRCLSLLLASFAIPFGVRIARRVLPTEAAAVGAAALFVVMPEGIINFSRVGNECLVIALLTPLIWLSLEVLDRGLSWQRTVAIGVLLGAGLLAKAFFIALAVPAIVICAMASRVRAAAALASRWGSRAGGTSGSTG